MEELDLLKKDWKRSENSFSQLSEKEIYSMLHKKSSSIVKWILIISILEVLMWTSLGLLTNTNEYLQKIGHVEFQKYFQWFNYFNYSVVLMFIILFYRNYVRISATASTRQLMDDIIRTRKTVNYYVWYNLAMIMLILVIGFAIALAFNPEMERITAQENKSSLIVLIVILGIIVLLFGFLFWLFYRLIYGIFLRKLRANYKELQKIDL